MAQNFDFTEEEIRRKLEELGYSHIPRDKLKQFQRDLKELIESERSTSEESGLLRSEESPSVSDSYYTDSYLERSKDTEISSSLHDALDSSTEPHRFVNRHRSPLEDSVFPRPKSAPSLAKSKINHQPYGKENVRHHPVKAPTRGESTSTAESSPQEQSRPSSRNIKRKVLRRKDGEPRVFDESFTTNDSITDISDLEQRLRDLPLNNGDVDVADVISIDSEGSEEPNNFRPWENYAERGLPSFIRPSNRHPHTRQLKKSDPVSRYHQFRYEWQANKAPGEKSHKNLRWNVRGKMLQCDVFEKPQRSFVPNNYVVPTEKKRQALRWEVRSSLARV